jgi:hypothetical protein
MNKAFDAADHNQIFLQMQLKKGLGTDENGNWVFDVEASNENLDFEGQRVLQRALLNSKEYFLTNGVVSKDHRHMIVKKPLRQEAPLDITFGESFIIGEPKKVYVQDGKVRVRGCLYKSNPYAQEYAKLLQDNSTRVKASVGGFCPKVVKKSENGVEVRNVVSVLWNDLALTIAPVNPTVGPAVLVKALTSYDFVKSLSAGYGTDSMEFSEGRTLQKEDMEDEEIDLVVNNETAAASLVGAITDGDVEDLEEAEEFLNGYGLSKAVARSLIREIVNQGNAIMEVLPMTKVRLWDEIKGRLAKSFSKSDDDDDVDPDKLEQEGAESGEEEDEDEEIEDATPVLKALTEHIEALHESNEIMAKSLAMLVEQNTQNVKMQKSLGEGIFAMMQRADEIAGAPAPRRAAVSALDAMLKKGAFSGDAPAAGGRSLKPFTGETIDKAKDILTKAVSAGEIDALTCGLWESQMNKSIGKASFAFAPDFVAFMQKKCV